MTDDLAAAKAWLTNVARVKPGQMMDVTNAQDHARTLLLALKETRLPASSTTIRSPLNDRDYAMRCLEDFASGKSDDFYRDAARYTLAMLAEQRKPATKEVDVWRVEWAEQIVCYPPPERWAGRCKTFSDVEYGEGKAEVRAHQWACKHLHAHCIRITGPHKQTVPV